MFKIKNKIIIISTVLFFIFSSINPIMAAGVLRVHPENPRYFTDDSGRAIYLTGSHTWQNLIERDNVDPPRAFNYNGYLDFMQSRNHNFFRMWVWELFQYEYGTGGMRYSAPQPYQRTGSGTALDGKPKFDLTKFNQSYFDRLRSRIIAARSRGIYVAVMIFEGHAVQFSQTPWCWNGHPYNKNNNINNIDGNPNNDARGTEIHTLAIPAITNLQKAYIKKVIDTVNDLDNIVYEISNETFGASTEWQYEMINYIKNYELGKSKQHLVGMTFQYNGGNNTNLFNSSADWISPRQSSAEDYKNNPPINTGNKIIILDTDHLWGIGGNRSWVWKSFIRGYHPIYMDPAGDLGDVFSEPGDEDVRKNMGHALAYANKMELAKMAPSSSSSHCSTAYCLRNPGKEYLVYQPDSGSFSVNLSSGLYSYEWFNPATGQVAGTGNISVSAGNKSFTPPFSGDAVLYLKVSSVSAPSSPSGLSVK